MSVFPDVQENPSSQVMQAGESRDGSSLDLAPV